MVSALNPPRAVKKTRVKPRIKRRDPEELEIVAMLNRLKTELDDLHNHFDNTTDPVLIDSYVYEIMALHMKYKYYTRLCREKGIVSLGTGDGALPAVPPPAKRTPERMAARSKKP